MQAPSPFYKAIVRFKDDPTGYRIDTFFPTNSIQGWAYAKVGTTNRDVLINLSEAYLIELPEHTP